MAMIAACLCIGLVAAPSASAASASGGNAKAAVSKKKLSKDLRKVRQRTTRAERRIRAVNRAITALNTLAKGADDKTNTILAGVPQITSGLQAAGAGLTALKDAIEKQIAPGLTQLKDAVEKQIVPNLTKVGDFIGADEYGIGQLTIGGTPAAGMFLVTPDISDKVQQAQTSQTFIPSSGGALGMLVGVRSAETDGTGSALPAAHCRIAIVSGANSLVSIPNAALGGAPFWPIDTKSPITSTDAANQGFPFGPKTSGADADVLVNLGDASGDADDNATAPTTTPPSAVAGQPITATLSCVDTSPNPDDPKA